MIAYSTFTDILEVFLAFSAGTLVFGMSVGAAVWIIGRAGR